jgi:hypothetical protein
MDRIRAEAPGLIDNLPAADPSRILLDRYHRLSTGFFTLEIASALALLVVTARMLSQPEPSATGSGQSAPRPKPVPKILDLS